MRTELFRGALVLLALVDLPSTANALDRDVCPTCTYTTIQSAVDDANAGDRVRVLRGTYPENLTLTGCTTLTLEGGWDASFLARNPDPSLTTIDGRFIGSVIVIQASSGCTAEIIVDGFTISRGQSEQGAGINIEAADADTDLTATVRNILAMSNTAFDAGGGLSAVAFLEATMTLLIQDSSFQDNTATGGLGLGGGVAVGAFSEATMNATSLNNHFEDNDGTSGEAIYINTTTDATHFFKSRNDTIRQRGGLYAFTIGTGANLDITIERGNFGNNQLRAPGIVRPSVLTLHSLNSSVTSLIRDNEVVNSQSITEGGGIRILDITSRTSHAVVANLIENNDSQISDGGGLAYTCTQPNNPTQQSNSTLLLDGNRITRNKTSLHGKAGGGGVVITSNCTEAWSDETTRVVLVNNIIDRNTSLRNLSNDFENHGGGVYINNNGVLDVFAINNTVTANVADGPGGGWFFESSSANTLNVSMVNEIAYGNQGIDGQDIRNWFNLALVTISHSNIGEALGAIQDVGGNISVAPDFLAPDDFHLSATSQCIDAGTATGAPVLDFDGESRPHGSGIDMGADELGFPIFIDGFESGGTFRWSAG